MGLIPLGILSSAGSGFGTYELIQTTILGSAAASVTFSGLDAYAGVYKHLQIRLATRTTIVTNIATGGGIRFNADSGNNYATHQLYGDGSSVTSSAFTSQPYIYAVNSTGTTAATSAFGASVIDILDAYSTSKNKTTRSLTGTSNGIMLRSGLWLNISSLTSVLIDARDSGQFVTGSRFSLYGIR